MTIDLSSRAPRRLLGVCAVVLGLLGAGWELASQAQRAAPGSVSAETHTPRVPSGSGAVDLGAAPATRTGSGHGTRSVVGPPATAKPAQPTQPARPPARLNQPAAPAQPARPVMPPARPDQPEAPARPAQPVAPAARPTQGVAPPARPVKPTRPGAPLPPDQPRLVPVRPGSARPPVATPERPPNSCAPGPGRNCPDPTPAAPTR